MSGRQNISPNMWETAGFNMMMHGILVHGLVFTASVYNVLGCFGLKVLVFLLQ